MILFISVLRVLATCLITNSHYTGIYPTDIIANGGLIGDIIFFAVSGYCLYNVKLSFGRWYLKRLYRIYVPVWIISFLFILLGFFDLSSHSVFSYLLYPTDYHFVASIVLLYIPYYLVVRTEWTRKHIPLVMIIVGLIMLFIYTVFYDTTYYHIDKVREPFIRFLFFESMLLGAYFKSNDSKFRNVFSWKWAVLSAVVLVAYFASKIVFSRNENIASFQIVNQLLIFALLFCFFRLFAGLDGALCKLPQFVQKIMYFVANITLEIYIVQYVIIDVLRPHFGFPINWIVITMSILVAAISLHYFCDGIYWLFERLFARLDRKYGGN